MSRHKILCLLSTLLLCCAAPCAAQDPVQQQTSQVLPDSSEYLDEDDAESETWVTYNSSSPDSSQWQRATSGKEYGYRDQREYQSKPEPKPEIPGWYRFIIAIAEFLSSGIGKMLLWSALALILGFIAYRFLRGQGMSLFSRRDRKRAAAEDESATVSEEGLLESDWQEQLRVALAAGDTRLAIRYSYMQLLQAMQQRGLISYRPDKTNAQYARELSESLRQPFRSITRQYEYAWYGHFLPGPEGMESYMQSYEGLKKSISRA